MCLERRGWGCALRVACALVATPAQRGVCEHSGDQRRFSDNQQKGVLITRQWNAADLHTEYSSDQIAGVRKNSAWPAKSEYHLIRFPPDQRIEYKPLVIVVAVPQHIAMRFQDEAGRLDLPLHADRVNAVQRFGVAQPGACGCDG